MSELKAARGRTHLMDLLEILPLKDVNASAWARLSQEDRASFKLMCRQARQLGDQLILNSHITCAAHDLHHLLAPAAAAATGEDITGQAAAAHETLQREVDSTRTAFLLSRLPRLTSLTLTRWPTERRLASDLALCGDAAYDRVTQLILHGTQLSQDSLHVAKLAFPRLDSLTLRGPGDPGDDQEARALRDHLDLRGPVFLALHGAPWLTKLWLRTDQDIPQEALRSLAGVATLKSLHLELWSSTFHPPDLLLLTGLVNLERCNIYIPDPAPSMSDFAALLAAPVLTHLSLRGPWFMEGCRDPFPSAEDIDAALALLGALSRLQALNLHHSFTANDDDWAALCRLTQLTKLRLGAIEKLEVGTFPVSFPLLQQLKVGWPDEDAPPPGLLQTLLPLLPLPSLRGINKGGLHVAVCHEADSAGEWDAAEWAATLHAVLHGLALSPLLGLEGGVRFTNCTDHNEKPRSLAQVAALLRPTSPGLLTCVTLHLMVVEAAPCEGLMAFWPGLQKLRLEECDVKGGALPALVRGRGTLRVLEVLECTGLRARGWVEVAAACSRPLQVRVRPNVKSATKELCRVVQRRLCDEQQNIRWV